MGVGVHWGRGVLGGNGPLSTGTAPAGAPARSVSGPPHCLAGGGSWGMGRGDGTTGWEHVAIRVLEGTGILTQRAGLRLGWGAGQRSRSSVGWASGRTKLDRAVSPSPTARNHGAGVPAPTCSVSLRSGQERDHRGAWGHERQESGCQGCLRGEAEAHRSLLWASGGRGGETALGQAPREPTVHPGTGVQVGAGVQACGLVYGRQCSWVPRGPRPLSHHAALRSLAGVGGSLALGS